MAKLTKSISRNPSTKYNNCLELVYLDIGGPITPKTFSNYKYYITFLDSYSKYLEIELLRSRKDIYKVLVWEIGGDFS